jgi:two-component system alkaline phosphatase synthesis response regulator PhoP
MQAIRVIGDGDETKRLAQELTDAGYQVTVRARGDASQAFDLSPVAAVVLDLSDGGKLGDLTGPADGADKTPLLALLPPQALGSRSLDPAIDDFALLPLRPNELTARLRRLLDRHGLIDSPDVLRQGALSIDLAGYRVFVEGVLVELTFKEYELLRFLATNPDRVYTREALLDKVWGYDYFGGARTVDVHIRRLRSKIERGGHTFVETVRNVGYRFCPSFASPS